MEDDETILVGPDGQVLPCCYFSGYFRVDNISIKEPNTWEWDPINDQLYHNDRVHYELCNEYVYKEYMKRKNELNIFTNDLKDIINNEWFTKILPESWEDKNKISRQCKNVCTKCDE
jgi:hypothetical protein